MYALHHVQVLIFARVHSSIKRRLRVRILLRHIDSRVAHQACGWIEPVLLLLLVAEGALQATASWSDAQARL